MIGLPSLTTLDNPYAVTGRRVWLCLGHTDMRCGFDRLAYLAGSVTGQDPLGQHLFVFRSRGGDRIKLLYFDGDGYVLVYKRLEEGTFKIPKIDACKRSVELRPSELAMLLDGIDLSSVRRVKRYSRPPMPAQTG